MTLLQSLTALTKERDELNAQLERARIERDEALVARDFADAALERVQKQAAAYLSELRFWAGRKHEGDCEFSDKADEGCYLCTKAERERWPQTKLILEQPDAGSNYIRRDAVKPLGKALQFYSECCGEDCHCDPCHAVAVEALKIAKSLGLFL